MNLLLAAVDVAGPLRWRWELRDQGTGEVIAQHHVSLDSTPDSDQVTAFGDLYDYVRWHADPLWDDDEPRIIREIGMWARDAVLGEAITIAITTAAPATVLVSVPPPADQALLWPLELAFADGAPLAARGDVSFVYGIGRPGAVPEAPTSPVRVLAAFAWPTGSSPIALRRERYELVECIRKIANRDGTAIELRVLQYGVTRQRLSEVISSGGGWDVVHLAGHGNRAGFALERPDGSLDFARTADLVNLLRPMLGRLKLAVLTSCNSAAETATDRLRLFGLPQEKTAPAPGHVSGLARGVAEELGCAVVATRHPVGAEFLTAFNQVFYERMLSGGQPVGAASAAALAAAMARAPACLSVSDDGSAIAPAGDPVHPGLSATTVGVFGASAASLVLRAAPGDPGSSRTKTGRTAGRMAGFPDQPERFVCRDATMTAAMTALRAGSGTTAVLLHGMPGIGKTACALELAYLSKDQFSAVAFWRPPTGSDPDQVLQSLADALHKQLGEPGAGFALPPRWGRRRWNTYACRLREILRASRVLVVIDNLEGLLRPGGDWHDRRWEAIFGALSDHGGESRLVAASRFVSAPATPGSTENYLLLPVGTLPFADTVILARQLPGLKALISDGRPLAVIRSGARQERAREVLDRARGHPGLLELDDTAVPAQSAPFARAERERVERAIGEWAIATLARLPANANLMACFVAGLEPGDCRSPVINGTWPGLWRRLGKTAALPDPGPLLDTLFAAMLTGHDDHQACPLHPGRRGRHPARHPGQRARRRRYRTRSLLAGRRRPGRRNARRPALPDPPPGLERRGSTAR
ncbi:MAG: CHAT domain-containing protein [Trebonia sp.]